MSKHFSLGVIGHVDHGKTSLVKALTGMDTDRLPEEKARGMSIVLGYAWLEFQNGVVDLIDAPGHENFIRTMVAGATGIDAALLVVDAKEGIKPQTVEHLAITQLLGIRQGVVAITKCDQVCPEQRQIVLAHLAGLLKDTYLAQAPVVFTSVVSGEGLQELQQVLQYMLDRHDPVSSAGHCYLPLDRAFSIPGCGTVVTGTLRLGPLRVGDEVEIMPLGMKSTVRQLEYHGRAVEQIFPGQRAGVNLRQVKKDELGRGQALGSVGLLQRSTLIDVQLALLKEQERPLCHGQTVRLLFGTTESLAKVRLLSAMELAPGQSGFAQLQLARPVAAVANEPFIVRRESPVETIGGGHILTPLAIRCKRSDLSVLDRLQRITCGSHDQVLKERIKEAGYGGITLAALAALANRSEAQVRTALSACEATMIDATQVIHAPFIDTLADMCIAALRKFHQQYPARKGAPLSYCRAALPRSVTERAFKHVAQRLCAAKRMEMQDGMVRLFGYDPLSALDAATRRLALSIEESVRQGGMMPPDVEVLAKDEHALELLHLLMARGSLVLLPGEHPGKKVVFHRESIEQTRKRMHEAFPPPAAFTVSEFRMLIGSTRKFTVPLLEYFDAMGLTRRQGDKRVATNAVQSGGERSLVAPLVFKTSDPSHHG